MIDLNSVFPASSNLFVVSASNINESGQIAGMAVELSGSHAGTIVHAFLATPVDEDQGKTVADVAHTHPEITFPAANVGKHLRRRPHIAQSTITALSELPHHAFQHAPRRMRGRKVVQDNSGSRRIST